MSYIFSSIAGRAHPEEAPAGSSQAVWSSTETWLRTAAGTRLWTRDSEGVDWEAAVRPMCHRPLYRFRVLPRAGAGALREAGVCQARRARWSREATVISLANLLPSGRRRRTPTGR